jgi:cystathionine beta-lyase/cystathionine gamma-synthase
MERHCQNALEIARWLESQPKVSRVLYPGLPSHPQHELAVRQMPRFGGMLSVELHTDLDGARAFLERCRIFALAESLGGVESLIEHPALMTHSGLTPDRRRELGIGDSLIRISTGIEDVRDLIADLGQAMEVLGQVRSRSLPRARCALWERAPLTCGSVCP